MAKCSLVEKNETYFKIPVNEIKLSFQTITIQKNNASMQCVTSEYLRQSTITLLCHAATNL